MIFQKLHKFFKSQKNLFVFINTTWLILSFILVFLFIPSKGIYEVSPGKLVVDWHSDLRFIIIISGLVFIQFGVLMLTKLYKSSTIIANIILLLWYAFNIGLDGILHYYQAKFEFKELYQVIYTVKDFGTIFFALAVLILYLLVGLDKDRKFIKTRTNYINIALSLTLVIFTVIMFIYHNLYLFVSI
jgi:hypothetical protein